MNFKYYLFLLVAMVMVSLNALAATSPEEKLLFIGQQKEFIEEYIRTLGIPHGVMTYTSLQELNGLWSPDNKGSGIQHAQYWVNRYPSCSLQIGLYVVGILEKILQGQYDQNIEKLGNWIKKIKRPVYLRIGYEFDNPQNRYDPEIFKKAFQYIVKKIRSRNVSNVAFVWHSATCPYLDQDFLNWFPGEEYVDWFGVSFFTTQQENRIHQFAQLARQYHKPLMIAESTPAGLYTTQGKMEWFRHFLKLIEQDDFKVVCYINSNWDQLPMFAKDSWGDARIQKDPQVMELWRERILKK